ncbi:MAG: LCP family protein [Oscillospiraceae bacterium]|nr:LCP family protein [Oscillospiraceae bacterium]
MKLTGTKRKGHHLVKNISNDTDDFNGFASDDNIDEKAFKSKRRKKRILTIIAIVFAVFIVTGVYLAYFVKTARENPPPVREAPFSNEYVNPLEIGKSTPPQQAQSDSKTNKVYTRPTDELKFTFLLMALDDGNGNTDVIMAATLDATKHTLNIVSIPRDTLVNVGWDNKRANAIYANMRYQHGGNNSDLDEVMDATVDRFSDVLGYKVDYWVLVDLRAFIELVDAVGGVEYDVPVDMSYDDYDAGLHIHFAKGPQLLSGQKAMEVLRFRKGYANADLGRINTQQDFLSTAAQQILAKKKSLNIYELAKIFLQYVKTDLTLSYLIWIGEEMLKLDAENINFYTIPNSYYDSTYLSINVEEWLELLNEKLNPFNEDITPQDVSIVTRGSNGVTYVTDGNARSSMGAGNRGSSSANNSQQNATPSSNQSTDSDDSQQSNSANTLQSNQGETQSSEQASNTEYDPDAEPGDALPGDALPGDNDGDPDHDDGMTPDDAPEIDLGEQTGEQTGEQPPDGEQTGEQQTLDAEDGAEDAASEIPPATQADPADGAGTDPAQSGEQRPETRIDDPAPPAQPVEEAPPASAPEIEE